MKPGEDRYRGCCPVLRVREPRRDKAERGTPMPQHWFEQGASNQPEAPIRRQVPMGIDEAWKRSLSWMLPSAAGSETRAPGCRLLHQFRVPDLEIVEEATPQRGRCALRRAKG